MLDNRTAKSFLSRIQACFSKTIFISLNTLQWMGSNLIAKGCLRFLHLLFHGGYLLKQATTKINVAVDSLPQFQCCKLNYPDASPQHAGTIHIGSERYTTIQSIFNLHCSTKNQKLYFFSPKCLFDLDYRVRAFFFFGDAPFDFSWPLSITI